MKTLYKILFSAIILIAISEPVKAQDIEGIDLWDKVTKEQIIAKFGQPKQYEAQLMDDMKSYHELFVYDGFDLDIEGNVLTAFSVQNCNRCVLTKYVKGGVRIGDPISKLSVLNPATRWTEKLDNGTVRYSYVYENENRVTADVIDGKITYLEAIADNV